MEQEARVGLAVRGALAVLEVREEQEVHHDVEAIRFSLWAT
jgi:hypothetical protein